MDVYIAQHQMTVNDAPIGLLLIESNGVLIFKTKQKDCSNCVCYIVDSGEIFIGGDSSLCRPLVIM